MKKTLNTFVTVKYTNEAGGKEPTYGSAGAGAFDLYAADSVIIPPSGVTKVNLKLRCEIPSGFMMLIFPRSSIGAKTPLRMANSVGLIDSDYRGDICCLYENNQNAIGSRTICKGDRIAQGILIPKIPVEFKHVKKLSDTERGTGGFGSTGD